MLGYECRDDNEMGAQSLVITARGTLDSVRLQRLNFKIKASIKRKT